MSSTNVRVDMIESEMSRTVSILFIFLVQLEKLFSTFISSLNYPL